MNIPKEEPLIFITCTDEYNEGCYYGCGIEKDYEKAKIEQFREFDFQIGQERYDRKISKTFIKNQLIGIKKTFIYERKIDKNSIAYNWLNYWCKLYLQEFIDEPTK